MKEDDDDSTGGDLEIYRCKGKPKLTSALRDIKSKQLELVETVRYERNVAVFFVNYIYSSHGVTTRSITDKCRRLINFAAKVKRPVY